MKENEVLVSINIEVENILLGKLWFHHKNGRESASFEYSKDWLSHPERFALEPALQLTEGSFHTPAGLNLFGALGDSAPDRWGRVLMRRTEAKLAKEEKRSVRTLLEIDYLLGVNDMARQGAVRFSFEKNPDIFLASGDKSSIPPLVGLTDLLSASDSFIEGNESTEELKLLLAPGSSLGGARPKASVLDKDGSLAVAKFPRKDDEFNAVLWEAAALTLAQNAGIRVPEWRIETAPDKPVLLMKRFDRVKEKRIPFLSALSMLGAKDNDRRSYLDIAYALLRHGASTNDDLAELWRRMVFNVLISNTDDHLRNHAFLYERYKGWKLSPAYDMNPVPIEVKPRILSTSIDFDDPTASLTRAISVIGEFRLSKEDAVQIVREVASSVSQWKNTAKTLGISKEEIIRMSSAFEHEDLEIAKKM